MSLREVDETAHLVVNSSPDDIEYRMAAGSIKVYKRRWYILIIFTLLNTTGNILWNTWPPIQETCQLVLGWNKTNVLIIGALQALGSIISIVPSAWLLDTKGKFLLYFTAPICTHYENRSLRLLQNGNRSRLSFALG